MKKILFLWLVLGVALSQGFAQKRVKKDTTATRRWVREYVAQQLGKPIEPPKPVTPPVLKPACKTGLDLLTVTPSADFVDFTFQAVDVQSIDWTISRAGAVYAAGNTGKLTSAQVRIPQKITEGVYELQITATNCSSDPIKGKRSFVVASNSIPAIPDKTGQTGTNILVPIKDPLLPAQELTGSYELRYIESRPDFHLNIQLSEKDGQLYITDTGSSLQSASYTLNGWTDLENCGKLENEPIRPYRLYHVSKYSVARPTIKESWMAMYANPKADFRRSELFFYVVPKAETWNPAGETPNPIGRPAVFSKLAPFKLKNRTYGFEYDFLDETSEKKEQLSIQFNWKKGQRHLKLYSSVLSSYLKTLPVRKGFEDLTEQECVNFANGLPLEQIVAFDIEPGEGEGWIINYDGANFARNMGYVINRLKERGAMAYNWLDVPGKSPNNLTLDNVVLGPHGGYGNQHTDLPKYKEAYQRLNDIQKRENPYSLISTGFGYTSYDNNFSESDGHGQNISPQLTYLKALDASELWSRAWPSKEQVYFSWAFQEFDFVSFPSNHIVEIPQYGARARRTDNKPLYPPTYWEDNLTLGLINARYLFYWAPGPVSWNPAGTSSYNNAYTSGFSVWTFEQGRAPQTGNFYIGKEAMAINATVKAAHTFSQIQDAMDGSRTAPKFTYKRATKDGTTLATVTVEPISDGSWYIDAILKRQPFVVLCQNGNNKALLIQDVWSRPGRFTEIEIELEGKIYKATTEGNRLFAVKL